MNIFKRLWCIIKRRPVFVLTKEQEDNQWLKEMRDALNSKDKQSLNRLLEARGEQLAAFERDERFH